jgi:hypothetical protein
LADNTVSSQPPSSLPKRIEYKEDTLRFGRRRILIFEVFLDIHRKIEGGRVVFGTDPDRNRVL